MMSVRQDEMEGGMPASEAPLPPQDDQITAKEAVSAFGVTVEQLAAWRARGQISYWKRGYWVVMSRREIAARVKERQQLRPGHVLPTYEPSEATEGNEPS